MDSPDFSQRARLTELMDEPCSRETLRACLRDIALTNRLTFAYRPTLAFLNSIAATSQLPNPLHILDAGCGYGDTLRRIEHWSRARRIPVQLTGLDLNPDATAIAADASPSFSSIHWVTANILTYSPPQPPHLVLSSLFAHHLSEPQIVQFLGWMETNAKLGWFINDLSRAPIPYHVFRIFSRLIHLHPYVQFDGPVSIRRAFIPADWQRMSTAANLKTGQYAIQPFKPARLCVARIKTP
jgi:SAM-dependent methyltransferase